MTEQCLKKSFKELLIIIFEQLLNITGDKYLFDTRYVNKCVLIHERYSIIFLPNIFSVILI